MCRTDSASTICMGMFGNGHEIPGTVPIVALRAQDEPGTPAKAVTALFEVVPGLLLTSGYVRPAERTLRHLTGATTLASGSLVICSAYAQTTSSAPINLAMRASSASNLASREPVHFTPGSCQRRFTTSCPFLRSPLTSIRPTKRSPSRMG